MTPREDSSSNKSGWMLVDSPIRPDCVPDDSDVQVHQTAAGVRFVRTPEECFQDLPGYQFSPHFAMIDGLKMHYVDEGPRRGEVILLLHGEPTWSYLYRKMIPPLASAGFRVIAPDHIGMGRSDKPVEIGFHTFEEHVRHLMTFIRTMGLEKMTLFAQDWGGDMGLRLVGEQPELFSRVVIANAEFIMFKKGTNPLKVPNPVRINCELTQPETMPRIHNPEEFPVKFQHWLMYALTTPNFNPGQVVSGTTLKKLTRDEEHSYNAPYPSFIYKAAVRAFPSMAAAIEEQNIPAWESLGRFNKPFLFLAGKNDLDQGSEQNQERMTTHIPGAKYQKHERFEAGHFIQEDIGEILADRVIRFALDNSPSPHVL